MISVHAHLNISFVLFNNFNYLNFYFESCTRKKNSFFRLFDEERNIKIISCNYEPKFYDETQVSINKKKIAVCIFDGTVKRSHKRCLELFSFPGH